MTVSRQNFTKLFFGFALLVLGPPSGWSQTAILYGVTGDGADTPESLYTLSQTDATPTFVMTLGNGDNGEAIAFNPDDGLLYHLSGRAIFADELNNPVTGPIFESIDLVGQSTMLIPYDGFPCAGCVAFEEALALTYETSSGAFLVSAFTISGTALRRLTTNGVVTFLGPTEEPPSVKGIAFTGGNLYSVTRDDLLLRIIDPADGSTLSYMGTISIPGFPPPSNRYLYLLGARGLATHPDTGELWALLNVRDVSSSPWRTTSYLVTIDTATAVATIIGDTGDNFASIAFVEPSVELVFSQLTENVISLNLSQGISNSLDAKLQAVFDVLDDLNANNNMAAIGSAQAFINAVEAQSGKLIPVEEADRLIEQALLLIELLNA